MLKFRILPREEFSFFSKEDVYSYTKDRPGVLEDIDIFKEGKRSQGHPSDFSLFTESDDADILVFPYYLELFEYFGKPELTIPVVSSICKSNPNKIVVVQWNHDLDLCRRYPDLKLFDNLRVLNFNTSEKHKNDIILPFWTIAVDPLKVENKYTYGFIGKITHPVRQILVNSFKDHPSFCNFTNLEHEDFRKAVGSCVFSFCPRGAGLSSYRFFECFHLNTIPVLFADSVELPFPDINYEEICVRIPERRAEDRDYIISILDKVDQEIMLKNINMVRERFTLKGVQEEVHRCLLNL